MEEDFKNQCFSESAQGINDLRAAAACLALVSHQFPTKATSLFALHPLQVSSAHSVGVIIVMSPIDVGR